MLDVTHRQIKKWSLFKFNFLASLPVGLIIVILVVITDDVLIGPGDLFAFSIVSVLFSLTVAIIMTLNSWLVGMIKPDALALEVDQNTVGLGGVFR